MNNKNIIFTLFLVLVIAQLFAPAKMIFNQEKIINTGKIYKFFTQPLDPNDPFRGKYVRLNYQINSFETKDSTWKRQSEIFVYLEDSLGYAKLKTVSKVKLDLPNDYVIANVDWYNKDEYKLSFDLPFDRFYMEESKAKPAEDLVIQNNRNQNNLKSTYATVSIKDGKYVLQNLFIDQIPIKDLINQ